MDVPWNLLMFLGSAVCHQIPERSYSLGDLQMPVCARCIGIYVGFVTMSLFLWTGKRKFSSASPSIKVSALLAAVFFIAALDAILSYLGGIPTTNFMRTLSGLAIGSILPLFIVPLINRTVFPGRNEESIFNTKSFKDPWAFALPIAYASALLIPTSAIFFYIMIVVGIIGIFVFFFTICLLVTGLVTDEKHISIKRKIAIAQSTSVAIILLLALSHTLLFLPIS